MITFTNECLNELLKRVIAHEDMKLSIYSDVAWGIEGLLDGKTFSFNPSDADGEYVDRIMLLGSIEAILRRGHVGFYPEVVRTAEGKADVTVHQNRWCLSEHNEGGGPYCPMYGGFGATLEEAVADFEKAVRDGH